MNWKKLIPRWSDLKMVAKFAEFYYAIALALVIGYLL